MAQIPGIYIPQSSATTLDGRNDFDLNLLPTYAQRPEVDQAGLVLNAFNIRYMVDTFWLGLTYSIPSAYYITDDNGLVTEASITYSYTGLDLRPSTETDDYVQRSTFDANNRIISNQIFFDQHISDGSEYIRVATSTFHYTTDGSGNTATTISVQLDTTYISPTSPPFHGTQTLTEGGPGSNIILPNNGVNLPNVALSPPPMAGQYTYIPDSDGVHVIHGLWSTLDRLFTTGADVVNFNSLQPGQITAINAAPTQLYDGLGGNDNVTLPNKGANNDYKLTDKVSWNPTSTFVENLAAGQHVTIKAGDGDYKIAINGGNFSTIVGGPGSMDVSFNGIGTTSFEGNLNGSARVSGGGSLWVTGTLTGTATIDQNSTLEIAGTPAPAPNSDFTLVTFGLGNANRLQIDSPKTSDIVSIYGFAAGDEIDFANQPNLTLEAATGTNTNVVHIYNKSTLVDTLFFGGGIQTTRLEPLDDGHGGTKIIVEPHSVDLVDPQPPGEGADSANHIDWSFIHRNEGGLWLNPYVPITNTQTETKEHSGLTEVVPVV